MTHTSPTVLPLLLLACTNHEEKQSPVSSSQYDVVQTTVSMDYAIGALSSIDSNSQTIDENISAISGDPAISFDGQYIWQFNRYRYDTLRKYDPENLHVPLQEISLQNENGDSSNPQEVIRCAEKLFVSQHDQPAILILDPESMAILGEISLLDFIDEDGSPEASTMVTANQQLYVGLQRLNRNNAWKSEGSVIVQIDCLEEEITNHVSFGSNVRLYQDQDTFWVSSEEWEEQKAGIFLLHDDLTSEVRIEIEGKEILDVTTQAGHIYFVTLDDDMSQQDLFCVEKEEDEAHVIQSFDEYLTFVKAGLGSIWIGAHWGWNNPSEAQHGTHTWTLEGCQPLEKGHIHGDLAPVDMIFLD